MASASACAAGLAAVAAASAASWRVEAGECCFLRGQARPGKVLPNIDSRAPLVRCYSESLSGYRGKRRVALLKDVLLFGRAPGPAEEAVELSGASVYVQGATVTVQPKSAPSVTLWLDDVPVAQQWAEALQAATASERPAEAEDPGAQPAEPEGETDRPFTRKTSGPAQSARIAELESRVQATLHAAVERSQRIRELETAVEEGKEKDVRILELQTDLQEEKIEVTTRGDRIKELETMIAKGGTAIRDETASAILQDAMTFAEQMLQERDELVMDNNSAVNLKEAVEKVVDSNPAVNREVAELIHRLVAALRWPLALRDRMEIAEKTVQEQKEIQDRMTEELHDFHKQSIADDKQRTRVEADAEDLRKRLMDAEHMAQESSAEQARLLDAAHSEELRVLRTWHSDAEAKKGHAEERAQELAKALRDTELSADAKAKEQLKSLEAQHQEELRKVRRQHSVAEAMMGQVELRASELREQLNTAEATMGGSDPIWSILEESELEALPAAEQGALENGGPGRWKAAVDEAARKLKEVQEKTINEDVRALAPNKFEEIEQRLEAAERAVGQLAPKPQADPARGSAARGGPYASRPAVGGGGGGGVGGVAKAAAKWVSKAAAKPKPGARPGQEQVVFRTHV